MNLRRWMVIPLLIGGTVLTGCGKNKDTVAPSTAAGGDGVAAAAGDVAVNIKNFAFDPKAVTLHLGHKITFTNQDDSVHTATVSAGAPSAFDSGNLSKAQTGSFSPTAVGSYSYVCTIHQYMKGSFTVVK